MEKKIADLKREYEEKQAQKDQLKKRAEQTELLLDRASKVVSGLAGERERWQVTIKVGLVKLTCSFE